ncbi:conjugal transfer protein [Photobacterium damselae]|uniref:conjugal transfer protein n=1 Tax=Photobacterium damselae TaxID=38293 RepID=UPI000A2FF4B2|nr:conjugal transfer protein [Photobacterium damselae]ARR51947.1 hypothetical protein CAY62_21345 [Photobacterium damselae subsp. damselae]
MKKLILTTAICSLILPTSMPARAASQDDCAIWLCLPTGFPSGCSTAKRAFIKRIKKFKPPLPNIASCLLKSSEIPLEIRDQYKPSNLEYKEGIAAKMPTGQYIDGVRCRVYRYSKDDPWIRNPDGCLATYHWVQTYMDGKAYGKKYYYNY